MGVRTTSISVAPAPSNPSSLRISLKIRPSWKDSHLPIDISNLPKLPEIQDPQLARQALTLPNYYKHGAGARPDLTLDEIQLRSYEPLELLGDKQLGVSVVLALRRQLPSLTPFTTTVSLKRFRVSVFRADANCIVENDKPSHLQPNPIIPFRRLWIRQANAHLVNSRWSRRVVTEDCCRPF